MFTRPKDEWRKKATRFWRYFAHFRRVDDRSFCGGIDTGARDAFHILPSPRSCPRIGLQDWKMI